MRKNQRKLFAWAIFAGLIISASVAATAQTPSKFRPPAVPLVTHDPYFSIWSVNDRLTDGWPRHWTGRPHAITAMIRVDGRNFRIMGPEPRQVPAMPQTNLETYPTRTIYSFAEAGVELRLIFLSPLLAGDLEILARPVTYLTVEIRSLDGKSHQASFYFDASSEIAVNTADQKVVWSRLKLPGLDVVSFGSKDQPVLEKKGDDLRIDWGYFYLAVPAGAEEQTSLNIADECRNSFAKNGALPARDSFSAPQAVNESYPAAAAMIDLGKIEQSPVSRFLMLAYDEGFSIEYFYRKLRTFWRRNGWEAPDLLLAAASDFPVLSERCRKFDEDLTADMVKAGGVKYARIAALAYRQSLAAHTLAADIDGTALFFPKENFSNGCISTVDVIYPEGPMYLLFSPKLMRALIVPVLDYARSGQWPFPFAPHDLGTYPQANGQVYGGGAKTEEDQMPVEESGNMILLIAGLVQVENSAAFAEKYWDLLTRWAEYLKEKGLDPENQLCTDDFAGHLAHNTNLSLKAILALKGYAYLCEKTGRKKEAQLYAKTAADFAAKWVPMADDGDHYRLAFDKPGTWSQKYNLIWDKLLGFKLFPPQVAEKEINYYLRNQKLYGLPLDNRKEYTKLDWILWTATLADKPEQFTALIDPVYDFLNATPDRVPMTDWYWTHDGRKTGFQARPVVGGVLIKMLADPGLRAKWPAK